MSDELQPGELQALRAAMEERGLVPQRASSKVVQLGRTYDERRQARRPRVDAWSETALGQRALKTARARLDEQLHQVLADLEATSCGVTASLDGNGGGSFSSAPPKSGGARINWSGRAGVEDDPPHIRYRREWEAIRGKCCWRLERTTDRDGRMTVLATAKADTEALLVRARDELDWILHSRAGQGSETEDEKTDRLLDEGEGFRAGEVALKFSMTESAVRKTRMRHGREPELGRDDLTRTMPDGTRDERAARARALMEQGNSLRFAAKLMGVSHETVRRDLMYRGEAKAA